MTTGPRKKQTKKISTRIKKLPPRNRVKQEDCWDLSSLFSGDTAWEQAFKRWQKQIPQYEKFRGKLAKGGSILAACLEFDSRMERAAERLEYYAFLKTAEDSTNSTYQNMLGRFRNAAQQAEELASYIRPELLSIPKSKIKTNKLSQQHQNSNFFLRPNGFESRMGSNLLSGTYTTVLA